VCEFSERSHGELKQENKYFSEQLHNCRRITHALKNSVSKVTKQGEILPITLLDKLAVPDQHSQLEHSCGCGTLRHTSASV
jgi:hypothetical protein